MSRRGLSLVEVMVGSGVMALMLGSSLALFRPPEVIIGQRRSTAAALLANAMHRIADLPIGQLVAITGAGEERPGGFREIPLDRLGVAPPAEEAGAGALEPRLLVRVVHHVGGRFGLHRIDGALEFRDGRTTHRLVRSEIRRNASELAALSALRSWTEVDRMPDGEFQAGIARMSHTAPLVLSRRSGDGPWLVPLLPARLRRFYASRSENRSAPPAELVGPCSEGVFTRDLPRPGTASPRSICD